LAEHLKISEVTNEYETVKQLFLEYAEWLNFDLCFQDFDEELKNLEKVYGYPGGCILLAYYKDAAAGCVALRKIDDVTCEMKRLYVKKEFRGLKIGRILSEEIIKKASGRGYKIMRLDTLERMNEAVNLYVSLGFKRTAPYRVNPLPDVIFMELVIRNKN
jgi:putative acetyltransferase